MKTETLTEHIRSVIVKRQLEKDRALLLESEWRKSVWLYRDWGQPTFEESIRIHFGYSTVDAAKRAWFIAGEELLRLNKDEYEKLLID